METPLHLFFQWFILSLVVLYAAKALFYFVFITTKKNPFAGNAAAPDKTVRPSVDVVVPMHNEEQVIGRTLDALLRSSYPIHILLVDDGSTDHTVSAVRPYLAAHRHIRLLTQENRGKSVALNNAIAASTSDILVCIDADTLVGPDTIRQLTKRFVNEKVAAVSGNLRVANLSNWLTFNQDMEYICISNYEREIFERVNGIIILPGAIGAFRKDRLAEAGGYNPRRITEDIDVVLKIKEKHHIVLNAEQAVGYTEVPQTLGMYLRQRVRWRTGILQTIFGYLAKDISNSWFYALVIPYMLIFRITLPFITPFADYYILYALFQQADTLPLWLYVGFIGIDSSVCMYILGKKKQPHYALAVPFQRLCLRQLGLLVNADILYKLLKGELFKWRRCERYGTLK